MRRRPDGAVSGGMSESPFADLRGLPYYDEPTLHLNIGGRLWAWEFDGWKPESMSWKTGCYIHAGLSRHADDFSGPGRQEFFSIDRRQRLRELPGSASIEARDLLQRRRAHDRRTRSSSATTSTSSAIFAGPPVAALQAATTSPASTCRSTRRRDLPLPDRRPDVAGDARARDRREPARHRVPALPRRQRSTARPSRSAASACPATSPTSCAARSRTAPRSTTPSSAQGQDLGIQRLGWRTYLVNHVEGGFPQMNVDVLQRGRPGPRLRGVRRSRAVHAAAHVSGSVDPADMRARLPHAGRARLAARGEVRPRLHRARGAGGRGRRPEADHRHAALEPRGRRRHLRLPAAARRGVQDDRPPHVTVLDARA